MGFHFGKKYFVNRNAELSVDRSGNAVLLRIETLYA